jgi:hypothetical protein
MPTRGCSRRHAPHRTRPHRDLMDLDRSDHTGRVRVWRRRIAGVRADRPK